MPRENKQQKNNKETDCRSELSSNKTRRQLHVGNIKIINTLNANDSKQRTTIVVEYKIV